MTILKSVLKMIAVGALLLPTSILAADFLINTSIADPDKGSGSRYDNGFAYNVNQMDVQWTTDGAVTVDVYTNFIEHNNEYGSGYYGAGKIVLGDLLISTNGADTPFNYAFILSDGRDTNYSNTYSHFNHEHQNWYDKSWNNKGTFTEISSTETSKDFHGNYSSTLNGEVMAGSTVGSGVESDWSVINYGNRSEFNGANDVISFSFNVNGINAFQNATQLAFSWGMSCANDIVSGVANVNRPSDGSSEIPEPTMLLLFIIALGFMANSRKNRAS